MPGLVVNVLTHSQVRLKFANYCCRVLKYTVSCNLKALIYLVWDGIQIDFRSVWDDWDSHSYLRGTKPEDSSFPGPRTMCSVLSLGPTTVKC